ncbi:MAG: peptidylprolyl isomerase [Candidatus Omnitrophica bacterium]|nr:peptidylprolyl isomerase [Candidatus Omnitrophota bacterium]
MSQAKQGDTVKIHYTGKLKNNSVFDSSRSRDPFEFILGSGQVIAGFEEGTLGMKIGQTKTITIPCDKAYGPRNEDLIAVVARGHLPKDLEPKIGQRLGIHNENNQKIPVVITALTEKDVTVDGNHPLAGEDLIFELELVEIIS